MPQTLQIAVFLLYMDCVFGLLGLSGADVSQAFLQIKLHVAAGLASLLVKLLFLGLGAAAYGIANEKKWAYLLALGLTVADALLLVWAYRGLFSLLQHAPLAALFTGARVALLVHPMSRNHQRIWFK